MLVSMNKINQRLAYIKDSPTERRNASGKKLPYAIYECECGNIVERWKPDVTRNKVKSCGKCNGHRMSSTRFYRIWKAMLTRTTNTAYPEYHLYGGRGIKVCDKWLSFDGFKNDMYESYLDHCNLYGISETQIDRIDTNGNYCLENCRWVTRMEQVMNRRNTIKVHYKGGIATIREIATIEGKTYSTVYEKYINGRYERTTL